MKESVAGTRDGAGDRTTPDNGDVHVYGDLQGRSVASIPVASLLPGELLRSKGQDKEHIARLAEVDGRLPPILVARRTMKVIDGVHRLLAASLKGQEMIDVIYFDGTDEDAFLCAVQANVRHGLPLSRADRRAAAARIVASHPHLSDRAIARASGLGAKAVASIRRESNSVPRLNARMGRDGRNHPLNSVDGRLKAAEVLARHPEASLREVARIAGISPATVSDVRNRIAAGRLPVTERSQVTVEKPPIRARRKNIPKTRSLDEEDAAGALEKLLRDPSLRHKEEGRQLLRLLQQNAISMADWTQLTTAVPPHCGALVANLARHYAETWMGFAQELDEQVQAVMGGAMNAQR